ncbi:serine protease [Flavobacterium sp. H122]|uniref:S1 family peptidase n=1 Tax=Flavobacterium sp. H122 TaxID=2529860 RepID=UPI0010AA4552|nr:serine protease [Flavobacterium sp. H122]
MEDQINKPLNETNNQEPNTATNEESKSNKKKIIIIACSLLILIGVSSFAYYKYFNPKEQKADFVCLHGQTEIYEKYKNAVGLVKHEYAYQISIKGGKPFDLSAEAASALGLNGSAVTGTGFFVDEEGKIITNKHVAEPWLYVNGKYEEISQYPAEVIASFVPSDLEASEYKNYIEENYGKYFEETEEARYAEEEEYSEVAEVADSSATISNENDSIALAAGIENALKIAAESDIEHLKPEDIEILPKTVSISIALHDSKDKWIDCKVLEVSKDTEIDVAVLQTANEELPNSVANYIDLNTATVDDEHIKPGTKAVLIGYPMGMTLANTRKGIKVQVYEGQINKESDGVSLQYNVTSTHGASGSPVFDECGRFIAVNYAGYDQAQGYNFGIVAKHAIDLIK